MGNPAPSAPKSNPMLVSVDLLRDKKDFYRLVFSRRIRRGVNDGADGGVTH